MSREPMPNVIVLLPGIMGSELWKNGKKIWGFSAGVFGSALLTRGSSLKKELSLANDDPNQDDLGDGITAKAIIPDLHLIPGFWKIDGYSKVSNTIKERFKVTEGENFFHFPYDWRRDNQVSASKLKNQTREWLERWRKKGNAQAKLILIAHSMGGLVSRYFLEKLEGWKDTLALITIGTPYSGSLNALDALANGIRKGPLGLVDLSEMVRSFTSLYQLLPIYKCYDDGGGDLKIVGKTSGIPNLDPARAEAALKFHDDITNAVNKNSNKSSYMKDRYRVHLVVGIAQQTKQLAKLVNGQVEFHNQLRGVDLSGDGTVPRVSATPPEYTNAGYEMFAATKHGSLQNADPVLIQLEGLLTGFSIHWNLLLKMFMVSPKRIALEVEDLTFDDEPLVIRIRPDKAKEAMLNVAVTDVENGTIVREYKFKASGDGWHKVEHDPLPQGAYRVKVFGPGIEPVEDAIAVAQRVEV
jgi:hypothetical protein